MGEMAEDEINRAMDADWMDRPRYRRVPGGPTLPLEAAVATMTGLAGKALGEMVAGTARFGSEPPIGSVLRWEAAGTYGRGVGKALVYLALRTPGGWWTTRDDRRGAVPWPQIVSWVADNPCSVATAWTEIPAPEPEPSGDDVVSAWASQFRRTEADG